MLFNWPCVLVGLTRKWFEMKIFTSNHFRTHAQRERQRSHPNHATNPEPRALQLRTLRLCRSTSTLNRTQITPFDFAREPRSQITPSTSSRSHPKIAPRRHQSHWDHNWEMVRFRWIWPYLTGFDEFFLVGFCFCVYLLRNCIIYLFRSWENVRNKKKMCFLYYFQEHNQTLENIFQSIYWNATKHLKIFSFSKNSISKKYLFSGKYFT